MPKIYVQNAPIVWQQTTASLASSGSLTSGVYKSAGFSRLVGMVATSASTKAASGLRISQSADSGSNFDYWTDYAVSACSGSSFSIEVVGNAVKIDLINGADNASEVRALFYLRAV